MRPVLAEAGSSFATAPKFTLRRTPAGKAGGTRMDAYLEFLRTGTGLAIEGAMDSDDLARRIVADPALYGGLDLRQKAVLVLEMLDGFTGDDDEDAILAVLRDVQRTGRLQDLLVLVPVQDLRSNLHGVQDDQLEAILGREEFQVSYEDCPEGWRRKILTRVAEAQRWVDRAYGALNELLGDPAGGSKEVRHSLEWNFHATTPAQIRQIRAGYADIREGFSSGVDIECESQCGPGARAYITAVLPFKFAMRWSDIHVCPEFFDLDDRAQTTALIHEMAHNFAGKTGEVYLKLHFRAYANLDAASAIENADSYGWFARHLSSE